MDLIAQHQLDKASQIYYCVVKSVDDNQCTIIFNNKQYTVPYYGGKPIPNKTYAIFLPHNNMNESFVIGEVGDVASEDIVPISKGGTDAETASGALVNFGLPNHDQLVVIPGTSIGNVSGETLLAKVQRAVNQEVIPVWKPFTGYFTSGARYYCDGFLYYSESKLYGYVNVSSYARPYFYTVSADVWTIRNAVALPLSVSEGGTEATTAAQAAKNLGVLPLGEVTTKIPSGANLNDYVLTGVYAITTSNVAATITNLPAQLAGTVRVFSTTGSAITASSTWKYLIQEYITYTGVRYQRYGESGSGTAVTWGAWATFYKSSDFKSGANYCKLPDGTMFQWGETALNVTTALTQIASSGIYQGTADIVFPIAFANTSYYLSGTVRYSTGYEVPCGFLASSSSAAKIRIYDFYARPASSSAYKLYWFAIGRWA